MSYGNNLHLSAVLVFATGVSAGYMASGYIDRLAETMTNLWQRKRNDVVDPLESNVIPPQYSENDQYDNGSRNWPAPRRFGAVIRLQPEAYARYRELHDHVWDAVLQRMYLSNMRNFVIYYHAETSTLYQHFEWTGHWQYYMDKWKKRKYGEFPFGIPRLSQEQEDNIRSADMMKIVNDSMTRDWWKECEPCQEPFEAVRDHHCRPSQAGDDQSKNKIVHPWWSTMECVAHCGHWPVKYDEMTSRDPDFVKIIPSLVS
jgi:L-rhamnose mutarotase